MIKVRIKIGDGEIKDTFEEWGLIYIDADKRTAPPEKKCDATSYIEKSGENPDPRTVYDAFDYKVQFAVCAPNENLKNANSVIAKFNAAIRQKTVGSDIMRKRKVVFYNDHDRVKIVGYPELIAEPKSLYRMQGGHVLDCAEVELVIHVSEPHLCDFNMAN